MNRPPSRQGTGTQTAARGPRPGVWPSRAWALLSLLAAAATASGCAWTRTPAERTGQAHYQTAYPGWDTSPQLQEALRSVKRIAMVGDYLTYLFPTGVEVVESRLDDPEFLALAVDTLPSSHSRFGTAVVVAAGDGRLTLLTSQHVVDFPERRLQYRLGDETSAGPSTEIAGVSVRVQAMGQLLDHLELGPFEVLAEDPVEDLALLGLRPPPGTELAAHPPLEARPGDPGRLSWGSFVYLLGFPRGYPMVTRAIVSDPDRDLRGGFLLDALWNEGVSGGPILAVRGEGGDFEWVGVARSGVASRELRVQPPGVEPLFTEDPELVMLYQGPLAVESVARIQYGLTIPVAMGRIRDFLERNREAVRSRGFPVP